MFSSWSGDAEPADRTSWASSWVQRVTTVIDHAESGIDRLVGVQSPTFPQSPGAEPPGADIPGSADQIPNVVVPPPEIAPQAPPEPSLAVGFSPLVRAYEIQLQEKAEQIVHLLAENQLLKEAAVTSNVDVLTREFSERLSQLERKYRTVLADRDLLRKKLSDSAASLAPPTSFPQGLVEQLRSEGAQLQARLHKYEASSKKLRGEKSSLEAKVESLTLSDAELKARLHATEERVLQLSALERRHGSALDDMKNLSQATRSEVEELRERCTASLSRSEALEAQLKDAWEQAEQFKRQADDARVSKAREARAAEIQAKERHTAALRAAAETASAREAQFQSAISELRGTIDEQARQFVTREEELERVIAEQNAALEAQQAKMHATVTTSHSAEHMLRQLTALQFQCQQQEKNAIAAEAAFRKRLEDEEAKVCALLGDKAAMEAKAEVSQKQLILAKLAADAAESRAIDLAAEVTELRSQLAMAETLGRERVAALGIAGAQLAAAAQQRLEAELSASALRAQLTMTEKTIEDLSQLNDKLLAHRAEIGVSAGQHAWVLTSPLSAELDRLRLVEAEKLQQDQRYLASLELLGEQTERVRELEEDLAEVKAFYRQQIDQLMQRSS